MRTFVVMTLSVMLAGACQRRGTDPAGGVSMFDDTLSGTTLSSGTASQSATATTTATTTATSTATSTDPSLVPLGEVTCDPQHPCPGAPHCSNDPVHGLRCCEAPSCELVGCSGAQVGECVLRRSCTPLPPQCAVDSDCPAPQLATLTEDNQLCTASAYCDNGQCSTRWTCTANGCGGGCVHSDRCVTDSNTNQTCCATASCENNQCVDGQICY